MPASFRAGQIEKEQHPIAKQKGCVYQWPASGVFVTLVVGGRDRYGTRRVAGGALVQVRDSPELSKAHAADYILIQSRVQDRAVNGEIKQCGKEQEPPSNVVLLSPPQRVTPAVLLSGAAWRGKWS